MALGAEAVERMTIAARSTGKPPFTVLLCTPGTEVPFQTDALACKPAAPEDAARLLAGSIRVRLPSRVLVVDDSATMRRIVRKVLAATRFPLEVTETDQGMRAVELARDVAFDIVFLDYNMPGFSGLQTIAELRCAAKSALCADDLDA
jgi:PleD family two-component response regulator